MLENENKPKKINPKNLFRSQQSKRGFSERFFPSRPRSFWLKASTLAMAQIEAAPKVGQPKASNPAYVSWLKKESMLSDANRLSSQYSGKGTMWQKPYGKPRPRTAIKMAPVWFTAYPISTITKKNQSIIASLGDEDLWNAFEEIGIRAIHTGPMKRGGGIDGWRWSPSIDGHFDRVSSRIDPMFGNEAEFQKMSHTARKHKGIVIDDIVPGHTGKGADFVLACMNYRDYPGIYHMVEVHPSDWEMLPDVPSGKDSINLSPAEEDELKKRGYIIGKLQRIIFYEPGIKDTNWSVTKPIRGVDNVTRRWVYLHYFKEGQPSINWLDPTFAGMKLVVGDALHSIGQLGSSAVRLDANGFLGLEKGDDDKPAWSEGHPMSAAANQIISGMVRKVGGFTFQELNLAIDDMKTLSEFGPDLSYDFVNRPAYHHALATGRTEFLRLMLRTSLEIGVEPVGLVHALQNHDELTYELVHFWTIHKNDTYTYHGKEYTGAKLRERIKKELADKVMGTHGSYNLPFTENGIACTTASVIAAILKYDNIHDLDDEQKQKIKQLHLLLAMFNALQPGVFALSGWDMVGALTIDPRDIPELLEDGDTRWINRGSYDLLDNAPDATCSFTGMPKATAVYGSISGQLKDEKSFARQLQKILAIRDSYGIALADQVDIPDVSHEGVLVMVHQLEAENMKQLTVLNFSDHDIPAAIITSEKLAVHAEVYDMFTDEHITTVDRLNSFAVDLGAYQGRSFLVQEDPQKK